MKIAIAREKIWNLLDPVSKTFWLNPNGTITLYIHSNSNMTFRVKQ